MAAKSKGSRKIGRNEKKCARYFAEGRRAKNRKRKDLRIAARYGRLARLGEQKARDTLSLASPNFTTYQVKKMHRLLSLVAQFETRAR